MLAEDRLAQGDPLMASFLFPTAVNRHGEEMDTRTRPLLELSVFLNKLDKSKPWEVLVRRWKKARTSEQNAALFGLAYKVISEDTGFTKDELHHAFCCSFFGTLEPEIFGTRTTRPYRTTTRDENGKRDVLPWDRFSDFYSHVEQKAAEAGIRIPPPDPLWKSRSSNRAARHAATQ